VLGLPRAQALGITGSLDTNQRIALDHNAQVEKLANAVKGLQLTDLEKTLLIEQIEGVRLHVFYDRKLYASSSQALGPLDTSSIPAAPSV
jgi:hypothetical protein